MAEPAVDHRLAASSLARVRPHATLGASLPAGAHNRLRGLDVVPVPYYASVWGAAR